MRLVYARVETPRRNGESGGMKNTARAYDDFSSRGIEEPRSKAPSARVFRGCSWTSRADGRKCVMDEATIARYIKEIGRGKKAAGDLPRDDARSLFTAMLGGVVPDLQLGAILIALRVKGESLEELAGFAAACEASYNHLPALEDGAIPV